MSAAANHRPTPPPSPAPPRASSVSSASSSTTVGNSLPRSSSAPSHRGRRRHQRVRHQGHRPDPGAHHPRPAARHRARGQPGARHRLPGHANPAACPLRPAPAACRQAGRPARRRARCQCLARLPTAAQIAAEVRRRPAGAVIADICRDLGILPCHPLWRELSPLIIRHDGNIAMLFKDINNRVLPILDSDWAVITFAALPAPCQPTPGTCRHRAALIRSLGPG